MDSQKFPKLDRSAFQVGSLSGLSDEKAYWLSKTPYERFKAVEQMRQILYSYDPAYLPTSKSS